MTGFGSPRGWSAEEDSDEDSRGPPTVALEEGDASLPPESWAALADLGAGTDSAAAGPTLRTRQRRTAPVKHSVSLLERLASPSSANPMRQQRPRRSKSAGAARKKPAFMRGAALTDAAAPRTPTPELVAEGTSTAGDRTPRDDERPWLQLHKDHSTASPVVVNVADSEMLSYLNETFTFWHSPGHEAKWMLMRLGTDPSCATKPMGWVLASELVLRNQEPDSDSLSAFLSRSRLEDYAHGLRGLGVTDLESLALQGDQIFADAGLPAPARRILRRALATRSRELETAKNARRRKETGSTEHTRPQTAADFRLGHHDTMRTTPRFSSAASLGIGEEWLAGQRRSARATRKQLQYRDGSASPTRPSTAPPRGSASMNGGTRENSFPQHRQGFVGSGSTSASSTSLGVMSSIAAHAVVDRISAGSPWPQDTRRYSGGGFALSNRSSTSISSKGNQPPCEVMPNGNHSLLQPSGQAAVSLSQVVLSSASAIVASEDDSRGKESRVWLDNVATGNSLRRSNKARSAIKTQSSFGRVGIQPEGTQDETPLQPDAIAYVASDPALLGPQPLPRARPGYIWCARPGGGYSQMTVAQRQSWLDERLRCGEPVPPQVDPQGQPLPSTVRGEAARHISADAGETCRGSSSLVVSTWQLLEEKSDDGRHSFAMKNQPASRNLVGAHRQQRKVLLHSRRPSLVQVHVTGAKRRQDELRRRGQTAARRAGPGQANVGRDNGDRARSAAMHRKNRRGGVNFLVQSVQPAHDLVWNGQAVYA